MEKPVLSAVPLARTETLAVNLDPAALTSPVAGAVVAVTDRSTCCLVTVMAS